MRSFIDITDFSVKEVDEILNIALDIIAHPKKYSNKCKGKILATLFYEPSTRTRLSFESAMHELGGSVIGFSSADSSSASKGESFADTAKVLSNYASIIAMRTPIEGAPLVASLNATVPVINAGDGGHAHPTQTLTDLLTIKREKGKIKDLTVGFCGDLKYGRTVHSLISAFARYENIKIVLISPKELKLPSYVKHDVLENNKMCYEETTDLEGSLPKLDVLYMTRIQQERFTDKAEYEKLKNSYILTKEKFEKAKKDTIILHPLPRVNEISVKLDDDERACYFKQVANGKYVRMALILKLLKLAKDKTKCTLNKDGLIYNEHKCTNPKCVTKTEQELDNICKPSKTDKEVLRCVYCDKKVN